VVPASGTCTINLAFTPSNSGNRGPATLSVYAAGATNPMAGGNLTGTGVNPAGSVSALNFGDQPVGSTSAASTLTLTNTTAVPITLRSGDSTNTGASDGPALSIGSSNPSNFAIVGGSCGNGVTEAPGGTCSVDLTFTPSSTGNRSATLAVYAAGATGSFASGNLSGVGRSAAVTFSWSSGGTPGAWGSNTGSRTITVTNTGNAALTLDATTPVEVANTTLAEFTLASTTCTAGLVLNQNQTCTISVNRVRPAPGTAAGTLTFTDTGAATPTQVLNLSGN
jgi:hypothetical protein